MHKSWHQPESQPDFGAEFHTESLAPICYERRIGHANGLHDLKNPQVIIRRLQFVTDQWERSEDIELILNLVRDAKILIRVAEESSIRLVDLPA